MIWVRAAATAALLPAERDRDRDRDRAVFGGVAKAPAPGAYIYTSSPLPLQHLLQLELRKCLLHSLDGAEATIRAEVAKALPSCVAASVARVVDETQSELRSTTGRADAKPRRAASRVNANPATPGSLRRPPVRGGGPAQGRRLPYLTQSGMVGGAEPSEHRVL